MVNPVNRYEHPVCGPPFGKGHCHVWVQPNIISLSFCVCKLNLASEFWLFLLARCWKTQAVGVEPTLRYSGWVTRHRQFWWDSWCNGVFHNICRHENTPLDWSDALRSTTAAGCTHTLSTLPALDTLGNKKPLDGSHQFCQIITRRHFPNLLHSAEVQSVSELNCEFVCVSSFNWKATSVQLPI